MAYRSPTTIGCRTISPSEPRPPNGHVSLFGSLARDQLGPRGDIDLVLDGPADRPMTLFSMARAEALLEGLFRRSVDLTARQGLDGAPAFKNRIADDLIDVF